ncbi:HIT-like domain-containing protein [Paraphysoderma sedebokerense]|nr:HIT-like domain-containing protein [Paraphysoderma sedebokerense]
MKTFTFGQYTIPSLEVFYTSKLSLGLVNLKPIRPGHVLLVPRRLVRRFADLTTEEVTDLFTSAQVVGKVVEKEFKGEALTLAIQDGVAAGQTVHHVHLHVIPRTPNDFPNNDDIYTEIEKHDPVPHHHSDSDESVIKKKGVDNEERPARTLKDMEVEAKWLRGFFDQFEEL